MADAPERLKAACDEAVADPALFPQYNKDGKRLRTFCNKGVQRIAAAMGRAELANPAGKELNADALIYILEQIGKKVDGRSAALHAMDGGLGFACMDSKRLEEEHGHIAVVRPEGTQFSTTVEKDVPVVANVGIGDMSTPLFDQVDSKGKKTGLRLRKNLNCRASGAFPMKAKGDPDYWII